MSVRDDILGLSGLTEAKERIIDGGHESKKKLSVATKVLKCKYCGRKFKEEEKLEKHQNMCDEG